MRTHHAAGLGDMVSVAGGVGSRVAASRREPCDSPWTSAGSADLSGVRGGTAPRQPLPGTREAWPQRVGWLSRRSGQTRPPTVGTLGRKNLHTRILRSPPYAVSTTGKKAISQEFQPGPRGGPGSASGRPICSGRARGEPQSRSVEVRSIRGSSSTAPAPDREGLLLCVHA